MRHSIKFRPRARIIRTVGDRLISGPVAAIIEAVKNSHDADAEHVTVKFVPSGRDKTAQIIIEDNGHGMSYEQVRDRWMEPATNDKVIRKVTAKGRNVLGSKGIGRFSAAKLGRVLTMETVYKSNEDNKNYKTIIDKLDWDIFESAQYLDEIEININVEDTHAGTGTKLIIEDLRDKWNEVLIKALYHELRAMIVPRFTTQEQSKFEIYLDLSECYVDNFGFSGVDIVNKDFKLQEVRQGRDKWKITPIPLLDACDYVLSGTFDSNGAFSGTFEIRRGGMEPERFSLAPPKSRDLIEQAEVNISCGELIVNFFIFDRDRDAVLSMARRAGRTDLTYKESRSLINEIAGVKIYRDSYRIRPYGDLETDWLRLDKQRVQNPAMIVGHDQVSGYIIVDSEDKSGLVEKSSREGFEDTAQFRRLQGLVMNLFREGIGPRRYSFRKKIEKDLEAETAAASYRGAKVIANLSWVEKIIENLPSDEKRQAGDLVSKQSEKLIRYLESLEEKHAILEAKVALGMIVSEVIHEGRTPVHFIKAETSRLIRWWSGLFEEQKKSQDKIDESHKIIAGLNSNAEKLAQLFTTLQPLSGIKRNNPVEFDPVSLVSDIAHLFSERAREKGVKINLQADGFHRKAKGFRQDLQPAVSNVIDNALYWLDNESVLSPEINIGISEDGEDMAILISNNGPQIPDEFRDNLFDVGFGLKPNGSGLGLAIARESLARGGGEIRYEHIPEYGVAFKITFPFEVSNV